MRVNIIWVLNRVPRTLSLIRVRSLLLSLLLAWWSHSYNFFVCLCLMPNGCNHSLADELSTQHFSFDFFFFLVIFTCPSARCTLFQFGLFLAVGVHNFMACSPTTLPFSLDRLRIHLHFWSFDNVMWGRVWGRWGGPCKSMYTDNDHPCHNWKPENKDHYWKCVPYTQWQMVGQLISEHN